MSYQITREQLVEVVDEAIDREFLQRIGPRTDGFGLTESAADRARLVAATHSQVAFGSSKVQGCGCLTDRAIESLSYEDFFDRTNSGYKFGYLAIHFDSLARNLVRGGNTGVLEVIE